MHTKWFESLKIFHDKSLLTLILSKMGMFGLTYLSLSTGINASEIVWGGLWKQLMTRS